MNILEQYFPFWNQLSYEQQILLNNNAKPIIYEAGNSIHCAQDNCIGVLLIRKGSLRIYLLSENGREVTLYHLTEGNVCILSASCILQAITFDVFIDAQTDCELVQVCSKAYKKIVADNVYARAYTYELITERFSMVMWAMQQILFTSFDKRLAQFLLDQCNHNKSLTIRMTHEQIARDLGTAREVVSRMLKYFADEQILTLSRGTIIIHNKNQLQKIIL